MKVSQMQLTIPQLSERLQTLFGEVADQLAREVGFVRRERTVTGSSFAQALVFGFLGNSQSSMEELSQSFTNCSGRGISRQALDERFTARAAWFMERLVQAAIREVWRGRPQESELLQRFAGVYVLDSTVIRLPAALLAVWAGCGESSVKVHVCVELLRGGLEQVVLTHGRVHDQNPNLPSLALPAASVRLADLGYFKLDTLAALAACETFWVSRYKGGTGVWDAEGQVLQLPDFLEHQPSLLHQPLDLSIQLGQAERLACRLIAIRAPQALVQERLARLREWERKHQTRASPDRYRLCQWTLYVTNLPPALLHATEVAALYGLRWQIELIFKLWKNQLQLDEWNTANPWRILCELYAKLLAILIQHWCGLLGHVHDLDKSILQAAKTIAKKAWQLGAALTDTPALRLALDQIATCLHAGCRISRSASSPPSFQKIKPLS